MVRGRPSKARSSGSGDSGKAATAVRQIGPTLAVALAIGFAAVGWPGRVAATSEPSPDDAADERVTFLGAFRHGEVALAVRYRFETVDDDRFVERAEASTLRTTLGFRTAPWRGWQLGLEAEDVTAVFDDDGYANAGAGSLSNGVTGIPVVADPDLTQIHQAYIGWTGERWSVTAGRQEIDLGEGRFVGAVGWRQHHQSFDAARIVVAAGERARVDYTFASAVHRIFGDRLPMASHFLVLPIGIGEHGRLSLRGFLLDYDDSALAPLSTWTYGLSFADRRSFGDRFWLRFGLGGAVQKDAGDNPGTIDTDYLSGSIGGDLGNLGLDVGWERLGDAGSGSRAFQTPLATLHKWNGWADRFLQTPAAGLEDRFVRLRGSVGSRWRWALIYHDYDAASGGLSYGTELDGELVVTLPSNQVLGVKLAAYDGDGGDDTEKVWAWTAMSF